MLQGREASFISRPALSRDGDHEVRSMDARRSLVAAGLLGFLGVALGAFGAHALKDWLATLADGPDRLAWWQTAVSYHLWHALLLFGAGLWRASTPAGSPVNGPLQGAAVACALGIALFSGSLYAMTLTGIRVLGAVTPLGGVAFLVAWGCIAWAALRRRAVADEPAPGAGQT
jgi:uncharacterized membrane protein YgdD (TMEM256/DUF423 family)